MNEKKIVKYHTWQHVIFDKGYKLEKFKNPENAEFSIYFYDIYTEIENFQVFQEFENPEFRKNPENSPNVVNKFHLWLVILYTCGLKII